MGCVSSSSHKKPKKAEPNPSNNKDQATQKANIAEKEVQGSKNKPEPNLNIVHGKDSKAVSTQHGQLKSNKDNIKKTEAQAIPKNSTKETNEKIQSAGTNPAGGNQQPKNDKFDRILDDELLKEVEPNNELQKPDDSVAIDFEELKTKSNCFGSHDNHGDDKKGDLSLTLNLTDLKIEQHL